MKILLVDDHKLLGQGLAKMLVKYEDIEEVKVIDNPVRLEEIESLVKSEDFDIILLDINIKKIIDIDGLELCREILKVDQTAKIIMLTGYDFYGLEKEAREIGAAGFINKEIEIEDLYTSIKKVINGDKIFKIEEDKYMDLTDKEIDIVRLYAMGLTRQEIADKLDISLRTIANHLQNIYSKLDVKNYQEMIRKATLLGYVKENLI